MHAVKRCGIVDYVIVNVCPIDVRRDYESVVPFGPAHCGFVADLIGLFRCDFAGFERLANLISQHISFELESVLVQIFSFRQKKLPVASLLVASVGSYEFFVIRFLPFSA